MCICGNARVSLMSVPIAPLEASRSGSVVSSSLQCKPNDCCKSKAPSSVQNYAPPHLLLMECPKAPSFPYQHPPAVHIDTSNYA